MNTCSIGIELKIDCHKYTYCSQSEISEILNEDKYLLTLRTEIIKYNLINQIFTCIQFALTTDYNLLIIIQHTINHVVTLSQFIQRLLKET